jgi:O-antigen/teichoic acid export membrane protein
MNARRASWLLAHTTPRQILLKNGFWLAVADGVSRLVKFGVTLYVIRALGALEYGRFAIAFAFVSLFSALFDFGMSPIVTREFAQHRDEARSFRAILGWKLVSGLVVVALLVWSATVASADRDVHLMIAVLALAMWLGEYGMTYCAYFRAHQRMEFESWLAMAGGIGLGGGVVVFMWRWPAIEALGYAYLASSIVVLAGVAAIAGRKGYPLLPRFDRGVWRRYLVMATPLALTGLVAAVFRFSDSVILGWFGQIEAAGLYNAALRIVGLAIVPVNIVLTVFLPALSAESVVSEERTARLFEQQIRLMVCAGLLMPAIVFPLAPRIVEVAFASTLAPAAAALRITIFTALLFCLWSPLNQLLVVRNRQSRVLLVHLVGAGLNVTLNVALIPSFSFYGAAIASVATELAIVVCLTVAARREAPAVVAPGRFAVTAVPGVAAALVVGTLLFLTPGAGLGFLIAAALGSAGLYVACVLALGRFACFSLTTARDGRLATEPLLR